MGFITKTKFNAVKVEYDGRKFDSKLECNIYKVLKERLMPNYKIDFQPSYVLQEKFEFNGHIIRPITYKADFVIYKDSETSFIEAKAVIDAKGMETNEFKIKRKLFIRKYGYDIVILKSMKQANLWCDNFLSNN